jgi:hypothetical protein
VAGAPPQATPNDHIRATQFVVDLAGTLATAAGGRDIDNEELYHAILTRVGYRDGAETTPEGSADNDLAHERAHAVMQFLELAAGSTLPGKLLPLSGDTARDGVYRERTHLVAHLARLYPSVLSYNDPNEPDWPVLYIDSPTGQLSWHINPDDRDLVGSVPVVHSDDPRAQWDRHTTDEKYRRLRRLNTMQGVSRT